MYHYLLQYIRMICRMTRLVLAAPFPRDWGSTFCSPPPCDKGAERLRQWMRGCVYVAAAAPRRL